MRGRAVACWAITLGASLFCAPTLERRREQPVGVVLSADKASVVDANGLRIGVDAGDLLFAGDRLSGSVVFAHCGGRGVYRLSGAELTLATGAPAGLKIERQLPICLLPTVERTPSPADQHGTVLEQVSADPTTFGARAATLTASARQTLEGIGGALKSAPEDAVLMIARAAFLEQNLLRADAVLEYRDVARKFRDAVWLPYKISELQRAIAAAEMPKSGAPRTFALLVGVSKYERLSRPDWLEFAGHDAESFRRYLVDDGGGRLPGENVVTLIDGGATAAAIRNAIHTHLAAKAGRGDSAIFFVSAHGVVDNVSGYILANDTDPQDPKSTGLSMSELQSLLAGIETVYLYADVCHAGYVQSRAGSSINGVVEQLRAYQGRLFGFMASRPNEYSLEAPDFCGGNGPVKCEPDRGHGVFSYALLNGLSGAADSNSDGQVTGNELITYVSEQVPKLTDGRQHPREFGNFDTLSALATLRKGQPSSRLRAPELREFLRPAVWQRPATAPADEEVRALREMVDSRSLRPVDIDRMFQAMRAARRRLSVKEYAELENRLRVVLEDLGQQVLLRYLTGDEIPQLRRDYEAGAAYLAAARVLTPNSLFLEGRETFFRARAKLLEAASAPGSGKADYAPAMRMLERSAKIDPGGAYSYNALGIAYLEQAEYKPAIAAFLDAIQRAPAWAYPRHNLALTYMQTGAMRAAIRSYREAMRLAPSYSYLPYNLGLMYQRTNQLKAAQDSYHAALDTLQKRGEPAPEKYARIHNALGTVAAAAGRRAEARKFYETAQREDPQSPEPVHNLAVLLEDKDEDAAIRLWRQNAARLRYLPSMVALAKALEMRHDAAGATEQYRAVLEQEPDYLGARIALAGVYASQGRHEEALTELEKARAQRPSYWIIHRDIAKSASALHRSAEASAALDLALRYAPDSRARKEVERLRRQ